MKTRYLAITSSLFLLGCPPPSAPPSQEIQAVSTAMTNSSAIATLQTGTAVAIVFDTSGSMDGGRLTAAKKAFAEVIYPRLSSAKERVEYSLISCGGNANVVQSNTLFDAQNHLLTEVSALAAGGGTPLGESILAAYQQLATSHCDSKYIFILSDGQATGIEPQEIIRPMKEQGVTVGIYVVGFQSAQSYYQPIADQGGQVLMADDAASLGITFDAIFRKILKCEAE